MRIAIFTDAAGWHGRQLKRAAKARGIEANYVSLSDCYFDLSQRHGVFIPGFESQLPDAAFVRAIPAGSFEQVTLRLSLLHALRKLGMVIYNDARAIEKSVDKAMTSFLLHRSGIATPLTWVTEQSAIARRIMLKATASGHELVMKPLFGAQGEGLVRLSVVPNLEGDKRGLASALFAHLAPLLQWTRQLKAGNRAAYLALKYSVNAVLILLLLLMAAGLVDLIVWLVA